MVVDFGGKVRDLPGDILDILADFQDHLKELNGYFKERQEIIHAMAVAYLIRHHLFIVGPTGNAKSNLIKAFCDGMSCVYFGHQMNKFDTPEAIVGIISVNGLRNDKYYRITNTGDQIFLPEANIGDLDELFNASPAILVYLNRLLNEREFEGHKIDLDCIFSASNLIADDSTVAPLFDRYLFRFVSTYIRDSKLFVEMMRSKPFVSHLPPIPRESIQFVREWLDEVDDAGIVGPIASIRELLNGKNIIISDRRYKWAYQAVKGAALLAGRLYCDECDLDVLRHILWTDPADYDTIKDIIEMAKIKTHLIEGLWQQVETVTKSLCGLDPEDEELEIVSGIQELRSIKSEMAGQFQSVLLRPNDQDRVENILGSIDATIEKYEAKLEV